MKVFHSHNHANFFGNLTSAARSQQDWQTSNLKRPAIVGEIQYNVGKNVGIRTQIMNGMVVRKIIEYRDKMSVFNVLTSHSYAKLRTQQERDLSSQSNGANEFKEITDIPTSSTAYNDAGAEPNTIHTSFFVGIWSASLESQKKRP